MVTDKPGEAMTEERERAQRFVAGLNDVYGDQLITAILYGSAARGEFRPGASDLNMLVIVRDLSISQLSRAGKLTREWVAQRNPPPLMLTEAEWSNSADVFPIEYSEIRDANILLAGKDPFGSVQIRRAELRLQVEHELRSKAIQLREGYLVSGEVPEEMGRLLTASLATFLTLFRAVLRLAGKPVARSSRELVASVAGDVGFDPGPVLEVLHARGAGGTFATPITGSVAVGYLDSIERTVRWLDAYDPSGFAELV